MCLINHIIWIVVILCLICSTITAYSSHRILHDDVATTMIMTHAIEHQQLLPPSRLVVSERGGKKGGWVSLTLGGAIFGRVLSYSIWNYENCSKWVCRHEANVNSLSIYDAFVRWVVSKKIPGCKKDYLANLDFRIPSPAKFPAR